MRVLLRKRYYCDFCKRVSGARKSMERHERGCTNNPARVCGLCRYAEAIQVPVGELRTIGREQGYEAMREACNHCPACTLGALRQETNDCIARNEYSHEHWTNQIFDFAAELKEFWIEQDSHRDPQY